MVTINTAEDAPWKRRFLAWKVQLAGAASRNPGRGLATTNRTGVAQLYAWDVRTGDLRQLTSRPKGQAMAVLAPDASAVYYLHDEDGNELGHIVRLPYEGGDAVDITPDLPPYANAGVALSDDGGTIAIVTATREGFQAYAGTLVDGEVDKWRPVYHSRRAMSPCLSVNGRLLVLATGDRTTSIDTDLVCVDTATGERVGDLYDAGASIAPGEFSRLGDEWVLASTTRSGYRRPLLWNPRTGERRDFEFPELPGDLSPVDWAADGARALVLQISEATTRLHVLDIARDDLTVVNHPDWTATGAWFGEDGEILALVQDSVSPSRVVSLDHATGVERAVLLRGEDAPPGRKWRSVTFDSTEGTRIQSWVATPDGDSPWPAIIDIHGGPSGVMTDLYYPMGQAWLDHGFALLSINYRGSTTFGHAFQHSIDGDLGNREVEDLAAAKAWLVAEGIAKPDEVFLTGWSYGGYLTLQGLGRKPDLWAGGMGGIAIGDWRLMYEDQAETLRQYQVGLFGGTPTEKPEAHASASPITYAADVRAPLLVIQGSNDTRCPPRQLRAYEEKMLELGRQIEVEWFDAGHGSLEWTKSVAFQERMMLFAADVLNGRGTGLARQPPPA